MNKTALYFKLRWYGHVIRKYKNDWVKKCMNYEVEGVRANTNNNNTKIYNAHM